MSELLKFRCGACDGTGWLPDRETGGFTLTQCPVCEGNGHVKWFTADNGNRRKLPNHDGFGI